MSNTRTPGTAAGDSTGSAADNGGLQLSVSEAISRPLETIPATIALTALTIVTAVGFCRVFAGWEFLGPMLGVAIGVHAVSLGLRLLRAPGYIAMPISVLALFALIAWKYYPDTLSGPFPTASTWRVISSDLHLARDQFPSAVAPVAAVGGFAVSATAAVGIAALLSDAFAFRAFGRAEAAVPTAVLFVFASALGVDNHRVTLTAAWLGAALAVIAVLRMTHAQTDHAWVGRRARVLVSVIPLAAALAGCAAFSGAIVGPQLPGAGEKGLVDSRNHNSVTQVLSPLVDIRSRLVNLSDTELFTVTSPEPHYWRASGLSQFNGTIWGIPEGTQGGAFETPLVSSRRITQNIEILGLAGPLLPAAYLPTSVKGGRAYYVPDTGTLVEPEAGLKRGARYQVVSSIVDLSPDELRAATSAKPPDSLALDLPDDFPSSIAATAEQVTGSGTTVYDKAILLQNWFRQNFTYDLSVQRGHSDNALENFLRIKRGYCEQFSAAFAAMARSVGIPARVAVGFTYGDLGADGKYHVYGRNAHAWPEVWFDGVGWVSFEPTPGRGEPGTESYTAIQQQQAATSDDPSSVTPVTVPGQAAPTTTIAGTNTAPTTTVPDPDAVRNSTPNRVLPATSSQDGGMSGLAMVILGIIALGAAWVLLLPRLLRARAARRNPTSPTRQIQRSWERAADALGLIGLSPAVGETPMEHSRRVERMTGIDRRTLRELAVDATAAIYGNVGNEQTAARCALLSANIVGAVRERLNTAGKVAAWFDPRRAALLVTQ